MISRTNRGYKLVAYLYVPRSKSKANQRMQIHEALANLRDEPEACELFVKQWEPLMPGRAAPIDTIHIRNGLRAAWRGEENEFSKPTIAPMALLELNKGHFEIRMRDLYATVMILFLRDHWAGKTAICANPDCLTPYFVKKRRTQKYCESGPCVDQALREHKRLWWEHNRGKGTNKKH
jgi:hypothetical protein